MVELDYSSLGKAISQLKTGLDLLSAEPENTLLRDGVIQRFEFTYNLSYKMLQRFLTLTSPVAEEFKEMTFPALIHSGHEKGLLRSGWDKWYYFREARNRTSHTYDERKAAEVMESVPQFLLEAEFLYLQLQKRGSSYENEAAESFSLSIPSIAISPSDWSIVSGILHRHLPGKAVWAYGSRARKERVLKHSDLDLAIDGERLAPSVMRDIIEAFDECLLPFKVDVIEVRAISAEFRKRIEADKVVLQPSIKFDSL